MNVRDADGHVIGSAGNISVRVDEHRFVVTAAGVPYDELTTSPA
ncbi:MAG: class II aldolase/adducin family protein [Ilumatobacteraceae bacterium]